MNMFDLPFMAHALTAVSFLALAAATIGVLISLRELEFVLDAAIHAAFPGVAIGALVGGAAGVLPGALAAALVATLGMALAWRRALPDAAIAVVLVGAFGLGTIVVSRADDPALRLEHLLFGRLLTITPETLWSCVALICLAVMLLVAAPRAQLARAIDPELAKASGLPVARLDLVLGVATSIVAVAGVQLVGVLLALAMIMLPAVVGRYFARTLGGVFAIALIMPLACGWLGLVGTFGWSVAFDLNLSASAVIALLLVVLAAIGACWAAISRGRIA